ncbi:uncharacterized protein LOC129753269 [Uranotaenia lowii]|uniref:uncharacterized protein LOC129753269 n=1 Tax=Uranotaenia lowii TaxID=190385 RepID=UPI00247B1A07|nr:uncharacterized protein LOC129753269 [Uranotaenia lowii]
MSKGSGKGSVDCPTGDKNGSEGASCGICRRVDTSRMVQCDVCDTWFHYECVDEDDSIENRDWSCNKCLRKELEKEREVLMGEREEFRKQQKQWQKSLPQQKQSEQPGQRQSEMQRPKPGKFEKLQLQWPHTQLHGTPLETTPIHTQRRIPPVDMMIQGTSSEQHITKFTQEPIANSTAQHIRAPKSTTKSFLKDSNKSTKLKDMQLKAMEERQALEKKQLEERLAFEQEMLRSSDSESETSASLQKIDEWLNEMDIGSNSRNPKPMNETPLPKYVDVQHKFGASGRSGDLTSTQRKSRIASHQPPHLHTYDESLSNNQLAARHTVKDLPKFGGDPEDWPRFIAAFERTSRMCAFGNNELLDRLEKSLCDRALNAVKSLLLHPDNVPVIIGRLRTLFGNPESIIETMIKRVRLLPKPRDDRMETIIDFGIAVQNLCATIQACELEERLYNAPLVQELVDALPPGLKMQWALHRLETGDNSLLEVSVWIGRIAEACSLVTRPEAWSKQSGKPKKEGAFLHLHTTPAEEDKEGAFLHLHTTPAEEDKEGACLACFGTCSGLESCTQFQNMSVQSRWSLIHEKNICRKCLTKHFKNCERKVPCSKNGCKYLHHCMLHNDKKHKQSGGAQQKDAFCNTHQNTTGNVLLKYVRVTVHGNGKSIDTYAFIDGGSTCTLMEHSLWNELKLEGEHYPLCINWTAGQGRYESDSIKCSVYISGSSGTSKRFCLSKVHTVRSLDLPPQTLCTSKLVKSFSYLSDVSIEPYTNVQPRILLGMDNIRLEYPLDSREGSESQPTAVLTRLGWVIYGPCSLTNDISLLSDRKAFNYHICQCEALNLAIKDYFSFDSLGIQPTKNQLISKDDSRALDIIRSKTVFKDGRYETGLLWRYDNVFLPNSKRMALKRHQCLVKRMLREPQMAKDLRQKLTDYETKGYIRKLSVEEERNYPGRVWYLPIFPVLNPNKPGKLRIVWDAAAKVGDLSLNSFLLKGPDQIVSLPHVLQRFREHRVAVSGDIREMFHQVLVNQEDQHCQRFLWNSGQVEEPPAAYVMRVMTFGATCSPSCAQYVKNLNAERFSSQHPEAVNAIIRDTYVDDMLFSVESEEEAVKIAKEARIINSQGGFEIRGWLSNSEKVMKAMGESKEFQKDLNVSNELNTERILGMWWNTSDDCFTFKVPRRCEYELLHGTATPTKREVLRTLMQIYDPIGLLSNFLMYLKVLLQEIWRSGIDWDEHIEEQHLTKWRHWLSVLRRVETISIPRCYRRAVTDRESCEVQLHVFVDASENGYAAVAYFRYQEKENIECALITSKTRVAPLRYVSIPRLELQAAVIGVRLAKDIGECHRIRINQRFFWSDSRDVLCWLRSDHRRYTKFVGARVGEILEDTNLSEWNWVPTQHNVADEGTKWQKLPDFSSRSRWFNGPQFIWQQKEMWPTQNFDLGTTENEMQRSVNLHSIREPLIDFSRFTKWLKLKRTAAYVVRFCRYFQYKFLKQQPTTGALKQDELRTAENFIYREVQQHVYRNEVWTLSKVNSTSGKLQKTSPLYKLSPFLDEVGVLRMRGRIEACEFIEPSTANPIILPKEHPVTKLIVQSTHEVFHHCNFETVVNELRQKYQISQLRRVCDKIRRDCQMCKNARARPHPPAMASLPSSRLAAFARPFTYAGVDYFGPMSVVVGRRVEKRWGVLITCLVIRAVHIEIAHSLNTSSCILALRNFMARRGTPLELFSDRGTNFVGSNREITEAVRCLDENKMMEEFTTANTKWTFLPPSSPHMGGSWERLVQSVKKVLRNMKIPRNPTDEVLHNTLLEIEFIINSRPLTYVPIDNADSEAITPNHFLLGSSSGSKPLVPFEDNPNILRNTWKTSQTYANQFWKRWVQEYLPSINRRTKWHYPVKPIEVDDVVVIVDPDLPRNMWPKGRVVKVNNRDGQVRSALVKTASNIYERPAVKLAVLDVGVSDRKHDSTSCVPGGSVTQCATTPPIPISPH